MKLRLFFSFLLLAVAVLAITGCSNKKKSSVLKGKSEMTIVSVPNFKPYAFGKNGEPLEGEVKGEDIVGLDVDICNEVAKQLEVKTSIKVVPLGEVIQTVVDGKADVGIGGLSVTEERSKNLLFTIPYIETTQAILVKRDSPIKSVNDLKRDGVKIGCTADSTSESYLKKTFIGATCNVQIIPDVLSERMVNNLRAGKIDAIVWDIGPAQSVMENNEGEFAIYEIPGTEEKYAIALPKDRIELCEEFNKVIKEMKESGKLHALHLKNKKLCARMKTEM